MVPTSEALCLYLKTVPETRSRVQVVSLGGDPRKQEEAAERRKAVEFYALGSAGRLSEDSHNYWEAGALLTSPCPIG